MKSKDFANPDKYYMDTATVTLVIQEAHTHKPIVTTDTISKVIRNLNGGEGTFKPYDNTGDLFYTQLEDKFKSDYGIAFDEANILERSISMEDFELPYFESALTFKIVLHPFSVMPDTFSLIHAEREFLTALTDKITCNGYRKLFSESRVQFLISRAVSSTYSSSDKKSGLGKHYILSPVTFDAVLKEVLSNVDLITEFRES